ncbi:MAG: NHLP bacteriocin export ABC transporter permease/ATPase subunit [Hyphomicrobiales bacterium]|mgnify:CR=1 FL=1|nr:MAG: NHLP bacteriocin export ABC transporter permease/ATPase subunit [Hyphomicrobiales bacterium]
MPERSHHQQPGPEKESVDSPGAPEHTTAQSEELARIHRSNADAGLAFKHSIGRLDNVVRTSGQTGSGFAMNPAASAVLQVLEQYGFDPAERDIDLYHLRLVKDVGECTRQLGARLRPILLPTRWWKQDHGHLVGFVKGNGSRKPADGTGEDDQSAIALIRGVSGGYMIPVPGSEKAIPVTQAVAEDIEPGALEILPPLPVKVSGLGDMARFVLPMIRKDLIWIAGIGALLGFIGALFPLATGIIIDTLIPGLERSLLAQLGVALAVVALLNYFLTLAKQRHMLRANGRSGLILQSAIWDRILKLPAGFFRSYSSGDLRSRMDGISALRSTVIDIVLSTTITAVFSVFYLILLLQYDTRLALVAIAYVLVLVAGSFAIALYMKSYYRRQAELSGWLSGYVFQVLQAIIKLRTAAAEARALVLWADKFADANAAALTTLRISGRFEVMTQLYVSVGMISLFAAAYYLSGPSLSAGSFIAFLAAFGGFQSAFQGLSGAALSFIAVLPEWERAKPVLDAKPETSSSQKDPGELTGAIDMTGVNFAYEQGSPVLKDISLSVSPGEHVALVGPSGSGKSTIVRLLLALDTPQSGTVTYNNQDLRSLDLTLVRRQIGVVTQNGKLSAGTILDNVRGATAISYEDCLGACVAAGLEEDLKTFPMGIHTPLTEGATTLSGGQRQRLLIARALVNKPKILLFDEATSALDNRTQAIVTQSLERLQVTRIVIAHRLSTIANADRIYVLDAGKIVEEGSYDDLQNNDGLFSSLARRQKL